MHHGTTRHTSLSPLSVGLRAKKSWCQGIDTPTACYSCYLPQAAVNKTLQRQKVELGRAGLGEEKGKQLRK